MEIGERNQKAARNIYDRIHFERVAWSKAWHHHFESKYDFFAYHYFMIDDFHRGVLLKYIVEEQLYHKII